MILTVAYRGKEFFRIGYYVYNNYVDTELIENPPEQVAIDKVYRNVLADKPRITRFDIQWEPQAETNAMMIEENSSLVEYNNKDSTRKDMEIVTDSTPNMTEINEEKNLDMKNPFFGDAIGSTPLFSVDGAFNQN